MWFRSDLRVRDNTALHAACEAAGDGPDGGVVGVFAICPEQWAEHDWGLPKVDFLLRNLAELRGVLEERRIPLRIVTTQRFDGVPGELLAVAESCGCGSVWFNREYEVNERRRDEAVREAFEGRGLGVHSYTDKVHFEPGAVRTKEDNWYTVFSPFKRRWYAIYDEGGGPTAAGICSKQPEIDVASDEIPERVDGIEVGAGAVRPDLWKAGESHAEDRLGAFIENRLEAYDGRRDYPAVNGTSTMSPYLTLGVISPRRCVDLVARANGGRVATGGEGAVSWISEIVWREFYQHVLVGFPRVSRREAFRPEMDRVEWSYDREAFEAWRDGRTGYPIVDAAMRQLAQTGWMHNRLRMAVAMFLTKDLMIDWRWGERHFMNYLVDGDLGSNNGGWQWSASTGTDAQPWFRVFNPTLQGQRFDPDGTFTRRFVPELSGLEGKAVHEPWKNPERGGEYPGPIVDHHEARKRTLEKFEAVAKK